MEYFEISDIDFNLFPKEKLNNILISFNDGQGDNCVYNWEGIVGIIRNSYDDTYKLSNAEILDLFYSDLELNGNNSKLIYFDVSEPNGDNCIKWLVFI